MDFAAMFAVETAAPAYVSETRQQTARQLMDPFVVGIVVLWLLRLWPYQPTKRTVSQYRPVSVDTPRW